MKMKQALPWQAKIIAKIILSRLPFGYRIWQCLNVFKHGGMEQPEYALGVFLAHFDQTDFANKATGFTALELGPGDTLFSALIAKAYGGSECYLVDEGRFARRDMQPYRRMAAELRSKGLPVPNLDDCAELDDVLSACGGHYFTEGVRSFRRIPDASVDFIWSHAVLEHVRLKDFLPTVREMRRVLRSGGACSHRVDLRDHLGGGLNNLRFSGPVWESEIMACSGFYTNRIRYEEMLRSFTNAGFNIEVLHIEKFDGLPTPRSRLAPEFRSLPESDLLVSSFDVILRPATSGAVNQANSR